MQARMNRLPSVGVGTKRRVHWRNALGAYAFLSPTLVLFSVFILFPVIFSLYLSFHEWNMFSAETSFVGLDN